MHLHNRTFFDTGSVAELLDDARSSSYGARPRVTVRCSGLGFELREITLTSGEELPFRRNPLLAKTWRVRSGVGHADIAEAEIALMPGSEISIAPGTLHQIENRSAEPLVLEEFRLAESTTDAGAQAFELT